MSDRHIIKIWQDPFGDGFRTTNAKKIEFQKGVTILVGCNGAGKTTLLENIRCELKEKNIPVIKYSEREDGRHMVDKALFYNNFEFVATATCSSEGENISLNISHNLARMRQFIIEGADPAEKRNPFNTLVKKTDKSETKNKSNERWILLDAIDSGFSIDNIIEIKNIFNLMKEAAEEEKVDLYIIVSANAYEFANNENCLDVISGKYTTFSSYDDYKTFILESRKKKESRYKTKETK